MRLPLSTRFAFGSVWNWPYNVRESRHTDGNVDERLRAVSGAVADPTTLAFENHVRCA